MPSKSVKVAKRTITASKQKRPDGRGAKYSVSSYKRKGK